MGYSYGLNEEGRDVGYGVPAECDHPECNAQIDRGMAYKCDDGEEGCGLYFCGQHRWPTLCFRCGTNAAPFHPKPDVREWIEHKLTDPSWAEWRERNPAQVIDMQCRLGG